MQKKKIKQWVFQLVCFSALLFLTIFFYLAIWIIYFGNQEGGKFHLLFDEAAWVAISYLFLFLPFYSFVRLGFYLNSYQFNLEKPKNSSLSARLRWIFQNSLFWFKFGFVFVTFFALPEKFLHFPVGMKIASVPVVCFLLLTAHLSVLKQWGFEGKKKPIRPIVKLRTFALYALAYLIGAAVTPAVVAMGYSVYTVLRMTLTITALLTIAFVVLLIFLIKVFRAVYKRKKMIRQLETLCRKKQYIVTFKKVYRSILFPTNGPNIVLQTPNSIYECKLLCALSVFSPMHFSDNGEATIVHRVRLFKMTLFQFLNITKYSFESGANKVLVILPIPRKIFVSDSYGSHELDVGDKVNEYTIFSGTTFLNALDREVLK